MSFLNIEFYNGDFYSEGTRINTFNISFILSYGNNDGFNIGTIFYESYKFINKHMKIYIIDKLNIRIHMDYYD